MAVEKGNIIVRSYNRLSNIIMGKKTITEDGLVLKKHKEQQIKSLYTLSDLKSLYRTNKEHNRTSYNGDITGFLKETSASTTEIIKKNNNISSLIPEINSAKSIWVTSILSPTDLQTNSLSFVLDDDEIDKDAKKEIEEFYDNLFIKHLKMEETLIKAIESCLFGSGSYPLLVIPQQNLNMLKFAVNLKEIGKESLNNPFQTQETFQSSYNYFINKKANISKEPILVQIREFNKLHNRDVCFGKESLNKVFDEKSFEYDVVSSLESSNISLPEDFAIATESNKIRTTITGWFNKEETREKLIVAWNPSIINDQKRSANDILTEMMETLDVDKDTAIKSYKNMFHSELAMSQVDTTRNTIVMNDEKLEKSSIPIVTHIPSECVVPVGIGEEHIAYFVLVDRWGTPISKVLMNGYDTRYSNSLVDLSVSAVYGQNGPNQQTGDGIQLNNFQKYQAALTVFDVTLNKLLESKLDDFGLSGMTIGKNQMIGRCIFHHLLEQKEVGLILVPRQLMTYYAVDYREDGTGKSMLENMEYVLSMRSTLLVSKILAMVRSAVEKTTIEIDMSKNSNPIQTMRILQNAYFSKNKLELSNDLNTIVKNIYDSRVKFIPKNLKGAEDYSIQTSTEAPNTVRPDEDLLEYFDKLVISGFQVPSSAIQETETTDYATSIVSKNLFFANVVRIKRDIFVGHTEKFVRIFSYYFPYIREKIKDILKEYYYISEEPEKSELDKNVSEKKQEEDTDNENVENKDENSEDKFNEQTDETEDMEPEYTKEIPKDFNKTKGETIGSDKTRISQKELDYFCDKIMTSIKPTLPCPSLLKGKVQFEEMDSYMETLTKYIDDIYPDTLCAALPDDAKNHFIAMKAKIKSDLLLIYKDKVGKQDIFDIPDISKVDTKFFTELNQIILNNSKVVSDEIRILNAKPAEEETGNAW